MILESCQNLLRKNLRELVQNDYILLDLPYFANVGDVLIWQSALDLLAELQYKCLYSSSIESYRKPKIGENIVILFMGGGNFGDLWIRHQHFRQRVLTDFPRNPIVQLPQSVCFKDQDFLKKDIDAFAQHGGLVTICLREEKSYNFIKGNYKNVETRLMPDMVLGFDVKKYVGSKSSSLGGKLFVVRNDIEKSESDIESLVPKDAVGRDWPTMEYNPRYILIYNNLQRIIYRVDRVFNTHFSQRLADFCFKRIFRKRIIQSGIDFINKYQEVYSTRLHAAILAVLLDKKVVAFDNSYGKIKGVYDLWMKELATIQMK